MNKLATIFCFIIPLFCEGQSYYSKKYDIGVNTTSLISKVISAADDSEENPIGIYLRKKNDKSGIYLGIAALSSEEDIFENNLFLQVTTTNLYGRFGFEKYKTLSSKFNLGYGLVLAGSTLKEATIDFGPLGNNSLSIHDIAIGAGPVLRFEYKLNNLISFSTESSLLASYTNKKTVVNNGATNDELKSTGYLISTDIPSQLFINIHF